MAKSVQPMFSSRVFIVSDLTFRSLTYLEFIFVYGVREYSNFIPLHVTVQFYQYHLLKILSFFHVYSCLLHCTLTDHKCVSLFLGFLSCCIDLYVCFCAVPYCFEYCSFAVYSEVREPDFSSSVFLSQDCFGCSGSFVFPYKL